MGLTGTAVASAVAAVAAGLAFPAMTVAARTPGTGIPCEVIGEAGCVGAFRFLTNSFSPLTARTYEPKRNAPLEALLLAAAASPDVASAPGRGVPQSSSAEAKDLAAAAMELVAAPARLNSVAASTWRTLSVTVPSAAASPSSPPAGSYEMTLTYLCLRVEVYANFSDAAFNEPPVGPSRWVDVAGLAQFQVQLLVPFDTSEAAMTPGNGGGDGSGEPIIAPVGCGMSAIDLSALRVDDSEKSDRALKYEKPGTCRSSNGGSVGIICRPYEWGAPHQSDVTISTEWQLTSAATTPSLLARWAASGAPAAPPSAAAKMRLRRWQPGGVGGHNVLSASMDAGETAATAREAVAGDTADALPRLEDPPLLILFSLVPAVLALLQAGGSVVHALKNRPIDLLTRPDFKRCDANALHVYGLILNVAMVCFSLAAAVVLYRDFGQVAVRGYVALEAGTILYQQAAPEAGAGAGAFLRLTLQPVVEGLRITLGGRRGISVVVATIALVLVDLLLDVLYVMLSIVAAYYNRGGGSAANSAWEDGGEEAAGSAAYSGANGFTGRARSTRSRRDAVRP